MEKIEVVEETYQESKEYVGYEDTVLILENGEKIIVTNGRNEALLSVGEELLLTDLKGKFYQVNLMGSEVEVTSFGDMNKEKMKETLKKYSIDFINTLDRTDERVIEVDKALRFLELLPEDEIEEIENEIYQ